MRSRIDRFSLKNIYGSLVGTALSSLAPFRKAYSIKHRLLCVVLVFVILVPLFSTLVPPGKAAAADPTESGYTFYVPNSGSYLAQLKSAVDSDNDTDPSLSQTAVYVTGRIFGSQQYPMNIETNETKCAQKGGGGLGHGFGGCADTDSFGGASESLSGNPNLFVYDISYTCDPGVGLSGTPGSFNGADTNEHYNVTYAITLSLKDTLFNSSGDLNSQVVMHWAGFTTIQHFAKQEAGVATPAPTNIASKDLPQGCHPPMSPPISGMYSSSSDQGGTDGAIVDRNIPVSSTPPAGAAGPGGGAGGAGGGGPGGTDTSSKDIVCKTSSDILDFIPNPLDWLLCGIVNGMYLIVSNLDTQINNMLEIGTSNTSSDDPNQIFADTSSCPGGTTTCTTYQDANAYQTAWTQFRDIALALLVIVGLIIIIAQALGMEILDAYTIRKMLPRVLIATIGITLSWSIMRFLVTLSNDLGYGVGNLLSAPFSKVGIDIQFGAGGSILTTAVAGGALAVFDLFGLLGFVGTALVAVVITFIVLIIRQLAVILLIILAPIAMIAYVLPGTQRYYKFWWESLSKMLLMFPMIVALIATGHIFAAIASSNASTAGPGPTQLADTIIAIFAYFAPYFMVPLTFRFSGTLMGTIGGAVNSRGAGARSALQNFRGNRSKANLARLKAGTRLEDKSYIPTRFTKAFDATTKGVGLGWKGRYGLGQRGQSARGYGLMAAEAELRKTPGMQGIAGNNKANRILAESEGDEAKGRKALYDHLMNGGDLGDEEWTHDDAMAAVNRAAKDAKAAGGFTKAHAAAAFMSMAADGTAIRDTDDLARLAAKVGDGDKNTTFHYAANAAGISRNAGRPDLAAAAEPIGELAFAHSDQIFNKGNERLAKPVLDRNHKALGQAEKLAALQANAWESGAGGEVAYTKYGSAKSRTIRNDTRGAVNILKKHQQAVFLNQESPYQPEEVQFAAATLVEAQSAIDNNYGKLNNRIAAGKELQKDDGALQWYLDQGTSVADTANIAHSDDDRMPVQATTPRKTTNREVVKKIVGDRFSSMTPEEREQLDRQRNTGQNNEEENP